VRPPEILAAVKWLRDVLQNADGLAKGEDGVQLANLRKDTAEGKALLASAQAHPEEPRQGSDRHHRRRHRQDRRRVRQGQAQRRRRGPAGHRRRREGARASPRTSSPASAALPDRSGKPGYDQAKLDAFFAACADFDAWHKLAEADAKNVLPFGDATAAAYAAFAAVRAKIDDYFGRCRLAAFDPRALAAVNREQEAYIAAAAKDLTITASEVAHFPLAIVEANKPLPLTKGVNPAWATAVGGVPRRLLQGQGDADRSRLDGAVSASSRPGAWLGKKAGGAVEALGIRACARSSPASTRRRCRRRSTTTSRSPSRSTR
jgi:hypothetical protein